MDLDEKIPISMSFPRTLVATIDRERGRVNRSVFVGDILEDYFANKRKSMSHELSQNKTRSKIEVVSH